MTSWHPDRKGWRLRDGFELADPADAGTPRDSRDRVAGRDYAGVWIARIREQLGRPERSPDLYRDATPPEGTVIDNRLPLDDE